MIICRICAQANDLTSHPEVKGPFECASCGGAGVNDAYDVPELTAEQRVKARRVLDNYTDRLIERLRTQGEWKPPQAS